MKNKSKYEKKSSSKTSEKKSYYFSIICLSSDTESYKPMEIIKKYLDLEQCSDIKYYDQSEVEFSHSSNITNGRMTKCKFCEILDINKPCVKCSLADSYLIFINLEKEGIETQIDTLINYVNKNGKNELKFYFIGLYLDKDNIDCLNEKEDMIKYLEDKEINFEYEELKFDSSNELVKQLSYITNDTLKNKIYESLNQTLEKDGDPGKSKCDIF